MYTKIITFIISCLVSWSAYLFLIPKFKKLLLDIPNNRSLHSSPIPKGGGIIFILLSLLFPFYKILNDSEKPLEMIFLVTIPLCIIGFLDDRFNISPLKRYTVQLVTALLIFSYRSEIYIMDNLIYSFITSCLIVIGITAIINFVNFMDGIDGLVGGCFLVILFFIGLIFSFPLPIIILIGSLLSFCIWNWSPAKIFMGDVGSTFLGAIYCGLILRMDNWQQGLNILLLSAPLILDTIICIILRYFNGQNIFKAHKLHLYQRLFDAGWNKEKISLCYIIPTFLLGYSYLLFGIFGEMIILILTIIFGLIINKYAKPFKA